MRGTCLLGLHSSKSKIVGYSGQNGLSACQMVVWISVLTSTSFFYVFIVRSRLSPCHDTYYPDIFMVIVTLDLFLQGLVDTKSFQFVTS